MKLFSLTLVKILLCLNQPFPLVKTIFQKIQHSNETKYAYGRKKNQEFLNVKLQL